MHVFDPHYPYIPPTTGEGVVDLERVWNYRREISSPNGYMDYYGRDLDVSDETIALLKDYYRSSVRYTSNQLVRVLDHMKRHSLFEDALIIVAGDHGEEFLERNFPTHHSLYDANIRPGTIVKPPVDADWTVPDQVDLIDVLPTIARTVGDAPPMQCQGTAWQEKDGNAEPRIVERIYHDSYNVSIEIKGVKGIFTYESNHPHRPTPGQVSSGPNFEEYYVIDRVREGDYFGHHEDLPDKTKEELRTVAEAFVLREPSVSGPLNMVSGTYDEDVERRLKELGYL